MKGHCQICERLIPLKSDQLIRKHGSIIQCQGSDHPPIELDTQLADNITSYPIPNPDPNDILLYLTLTPNSPNWQTAVDLKQQWINQHHNQPLIAGGGNPRKYQFARQLVSVKVHMDDRQAILDLAAMLNEARLTQ